MKKKFLNKRIKELELIIEEKNNIIKILENELYIERTRYNNIYPHINDKTNPIPPFIPECNKFQDEITYTTGNPPWDFKLFGGNVMSSN